eukprot:101026-Alexandrium_andersonii.AAC.1
MGMMLGAAFGPSGLSASALWPHVPPPGTWARSSSPERLQAVVERSSSLERLQAGRLCVRAQFNVRTPAPGLARAHRFACAR